MIDHVQQYSQAGFALVKLNGKDAIEKGFPSFTPDPFLTLADFDGYNWGVAFNKEQFAIDVDPRAFKEGDNPLKRLLADCGIDPDAFKGGNTLCVKTGGEKPGVHIYLTKPADVYLNAHLPGYEGIDIKQNGGYVVGAGSIHPDTHIEYTILYQSTPFRIMPCPDTLLALLTKPREKARISEPVIDDCEQSRARFLEYIQRLEPVSEGQRRDMIFRISAKGRDLGLPNQTVFQMISQHYHADKVTPQLSDKQLTDVVQCAYKYARNSMGVESPAAVFSPVDGAQPPAAEVTVEAGEYDPFAITWDMDANGTPKKTLSNCINYLVAEKAKGVMGSLCYNEFTYNIEVDGKLPWEKYRSCGKSWDGADAVQMKIYLNRQYRIEFSTMMIHEAVEMVSRKRTYHPVRRYLDSLVWDKKPRVGSWLTDLCMCDDNEYTRAVGRKVLAGAVERIYNPGCQFDHIMVVEGAQGIGKSTLVRVLGGEWSADVFVDPRNAKDTVDAMRGKWIIEVSEMEVLRRADSNALKAFISKPTDRCRMAYARETLDYPRQCIFIGTINPTEAGYLSDETGNRRYWPIYCPVIKTAELKAVRDQLWAEAVYVYKHQRERLYIDDPLANIQALESQKSREARDPWVPYIAKYVAENPSIETLTSADVAISVFNASPKQITRADMCRIGRAMKELGWEKHRNGGDYYYSRPMDERLKTL